MSNLELRRKVGYKPRKNKQDSRPTPHGKEHSYEAFCDLGDEVCASAAEMDTVIGRTRDTQCILTLYLRPSRFQLALLLESKTSSAVVAALDSLEKALGLALFSKIFGQILTDNGPEFSNTCALESSSIAADRRCTVYYCDVRQSQQKARCERSHVEIRKLLPKGRDIKFDNLTKHDLAHLMSQAGSQPRPSLGGLSAIALLKAQLGSSANTLLDVLGVSEIPYDQLDLTVSSIDHKRKDRKEKPLSRA